MLHCRQGPRKSGPFIPQLFSAQAATHQLCPLRSYHAAVMRRVYPSLSVLTWEPLPPLTQVARVFPLVRELCSGDRLHSLLVTVSLRTAII